MKDTKKYYDYIDKLINDTPDFMLINDDESYVLLDRLVVDLSENAMTWLFKVYLDQNYNILKEDNLTDYIKDKYKDINLKVKNENGNVFLNRDVMYVILKELEENNQVVYEDGKFNAAIYAKKNFKMFSGDDCEVVLRINKNLLNLVIDELGDDVKLHKIDDDTFQASFNAQYGTGLTKWVLQLGADANVISPPELRDDVRKSLEDMIKLYR